MPHSLGTLQDEMPEGSVVVLFLIFYFYFMCMGVRIPCMFMHHVCSAHRGQKKALDPQGTEVIEGC